MMARRAIIVLGMLLAWGRGAYGLDPTLDVSQYAHTAWKIRDGFAKGEILSVAQTPDGYLWVGTEYGLLRFDGVRAVPWQPPTGEQLPNNRIASLLTARDGTLWIATLKGLASWKDGKLTQYPEVAGQVVSPLLEDRQGTVWIGLYDPGRVCAIRAGKIECGGAANLGRAVVALYEDRKGNLWVSANGLWRWAPGLPEHYTFPRGVLEINSIIEDDSGALLLATNNGLKRLVNGTIEDHVLPGIAGQFRPNFLFRSSDGSLWVGTHQGVLHVHQGRTDRLTAAEGLSGDFIDGIFEDREGSVWVATQDGLDRFRDFTVPTISRNQGLPNSTTWSVQASPDGSIWIGTAGGLTRWENGHMTVYGSRKTLGQSQRTDEREANVRGAVTEIANSGLVGTPQTLGQDDRKRLWVSTSEGAFYFEGGRFIRVPAVPGGSIISLAGDGHGNVWILDSAPALFHVMSEGDVQRVPSSIFAQRWARALLPDQLQDGVWLGFYQGGLDYLKDSQVRTS
ncbi:MAG TPA: two-component regulator propeller domain-containing protein, partial [Candidatus Eisenbacteria bacterium]|nr:two-component regulator propeller domain-containing protein [Candidatus Eisenbacteria bacterium]